jgi:uncharacterized protein (TIGR03437 family)
VRDSFCIFLALSCFGATFRASTGPRVLAFEAREHKYISHGPGYALSVDSGAAVLSVNGVAVRMSAVGANPRSSLEALERMPGKANYILGRDVRASYDLFGRIRWRTVYPGIDVVFRGNQEHLEYDFDIAAGHEPGSIRLAFDGVDGVRIDKTGDLVLRAGAVEIHQPKPFAYQIVAGQKQPVDAAYWMDASKHVRFRLGDYDRHRALVIDPQIVFQNFFGGSGASGADGLARDSAGNLYVTGGTSSTNFPTVNPIQSLLGTAPLVVSTNGGKSWSNLILPGASVVNAMAAAPSVPSTTYAATPVGVFVSVNGGATWNLPANTGLTSPATALAVDAGSATTVYAGTAQGVFVSTDGAATWQASTNGLSSGAIETIVTNPTKAGTVFASFANPSGLFRSTNSGQSWTQLTYPITPSAPSTVYSIVFGANGTIVAGTYYGILISSDGGNTWTAGSSQGDQNPQGLAISPANPNTLYLINASGVQKSADGGQSFNVVLSAILGNPYASVVVDPRNASRVFATNDSLVYESTNAGQTWSQLSLPNSVYPQSMFVSPANSALFLGSSTQNNVFVTKWSPDGSQILYSTYLGGNGYDLANAIAVDDSGSAYVTGYTTSPNFPTTAAAFQTKHAGASDVFVAKLSPDGSQLIYSTLLGTQSANSFGIVVDASGEAVITGIAQGSYPVTANSLQIPPASNCTAPQPLNFEPNSGAAFVTKIAATGNALVYSTLLGGSCVNSGMGVALDGSGNAWVTGSTSSADFPVTSDALQAKFGGGYFDGFLAAFSPAGALNYATYIGGSGYDALSAIAFDQSGNIYLTGESGGLSQPASPGAYQPQANASCPVFTMGPAVFSPQGNGVILKLDPKAHSVQGLTYFGAPGCLYPLLIAVDSSGDPWIAGDLDTPHITLPTVSPFQVGFGAGFISKFSADFTQLLFSTYFGYVNGLALDSSGLAYVAGATVANYASGAQSAYVAKIDPTPTPVAINSIESPDPAVTPSASIGIAPGEVLQILGNNLGPATATPGVIQSGVLETTVAGVGVTFDGVAAPLLSVSAQQIEVMAPFELAGKSTTTIQVQYNGVSSNPVQVAVNAADLQILAIFNDDFSANSASNPAKPGSAMILYVAGVGNTSPASQDGQINAAPFAAPPMPVNLQWTGGTSPIFPIAFAGAAPGLAAGIFQINFTAPQSLMQIQLVMGMAFANFNVYVQ